MQDQGSTGFVNVRIALRVAAVLAQRARPAPFVLAGRALALCVVGGPRRGGRAVDHRLATAMEGALVLVAHRSAAEPDDTTRLELAASALALAWVRPRLRRAAGAASEAWLSDLGAPAALPTAAGLSLRVLFALLADQRDVASEAVFALLRHEACPLGAVLHDWTVARLQGHGPLREAQCFEHLQLLAGPEDALAMLVASEALAQRAGLAGEDARRVPRLRWPTTLPVPPRKGGTNAALGATAPASLR